MKLSLSPRLWNWVLTMLAAGTTITSAMATNDTIPAGCLPTNLTTGLIACYPFGNGSLSDATGNGNDLTNPTTATPGSDRDGNTQCAYLFMAAAGDYLLRTNPAFLNGPAAGGTLSISLWYKPVGMRAPAAYELLAGRGEGLRCPDMYGEWSAGLYDCRRAVWGINAGSVWDTTGANVGECQVLMNQYTNHWQHLTVTYTNGVRKIYHDGKLTAQFGAPAGCGQPLQDTGDLLLGKGYTGYLDDVMVWNRELTISEVLQLKNLGACCGSGQLLEENTAGTDKQNLHLTPNPATDYVQLTDAQGRPIENATITMTDALGRVMMNLQTGGDGQVPLFGLPSGIYVCMVQCSDGSTVVRRLVVNK